jgi:hypothetical protein
MLNCYPYFLFIFQIEWDHMTLNKLSLLYTNLFSNLLKINDFLVIK